MKAVLALVVIYVAAFLVAIQGSAPAAVEASPQSAAAKLAAAHSSAIDPAKEADIRTLLDLVGARDQVQESVNYSAEQYREKLLATVANDDKNQPDAKVKLKEAFEAANNPAEIEVYSESLHGWCVPDMPTSQNGTPIYNKPDAERAWGKLTSLYKSALG